MASTRRTALAHVHVERIRVRVERMRLVPFLSACCTPMRFSTSSAGQTDGAAPKRVARCRVRCVLYLTAFWIAIEHKKGAQQKQFLAQN